MKPVPGVTPACTSVILSIGIDVVKRAREINEEGALRSLLHRLLLTADENKPGVRVIIMDWMWRPQFYNEEIKARCELLQDAIPFLRVVEGEKVTHRRVMYGYHTTALLTAEGQALPKTRQEFINTTFIRPHLLTNGLAGTRLWTCPKPGSSSK